MNPTLESPGISSAPARVLALQLNLQAAWERVSAKRGMPGADGLTVGQFERSASLYLRVLEARLAGNRYAPLPLRLAELEKKKRNTPSGGPPPEAPLRLLLVPCVSDRIAQTAVAQWLAARWNPLFDPDSYAYRAGMGVQDVLRRLITLRDSGYRWLLDGDIQSFFDSIDHSILFRKLEASLTAESPMLSWIRSWVNAAVWDGDTVSRVTRGVPQGSPLSPILANFYLHSFDRELRSAGIPFVRYADDFLLLGRTPFDIASAREVVERILASLDLALNVSKTRTTSFDSGLRFLGAEIRGEQIFLPFGKIKTPKAPVFVAPVMAPALLRAWKAGKLRAEQPLVWTGRRRTTAEQPLSGNAQPQQPSWLLRQLAGPAVTLAHSLAGQGTKL